MSTESSDDQGIPLFVRRRMPSASQEELLEATENVRRYLAVAWRIFERIQREEQSADSHESDAGDTIQRADDDSKIV